MTTNESARQALIRTAQEYSDRKLLLQQILEVAELLIKRLEILDVQDSEISKLIERYKKFGQEASRRTPAQRLLETAKNYSLYGTPYPQELEVSHQIIERLKLLKVDDRELQMLLDKVT